MKIENCLADFQILQYLHHVDNAATSLIPGSVINSTNEYNRQHRANVQFQSFTLERGTYISIGLFGWMARFV
jgi:hypothetical protein